MYLARHIFIARLTGCALLTFCFLQPPVGAWVTTTDAYLTMSILPDTVTGASEV